MNVLGIGGVLSDPAAALVSNGRIAAAVEEKKLTRTVETGRLPLASIEACLKIERNTPRAGRFRGAGPAAPNGDLRVSRSHCACSRMRASFPSITTRPTRRRHGWRLHLKTRLWSPSIVRATCAAERSGARKTTGSTLEREILYPDSIGELFGRAYRMAWLSRPRADEHLVQWLSATGEPLYKDAFANLTMDAKRVENKTSDQERADIAASAQQVLEDYVTELAGETENLCLAGGIAWNALLISRLETCGRQAKSAAARRRKRRDGIGRRASRLE